MSVMEFNCSPSFGGSTYLGFKTFSIKALALVSTSDLIEAVTEAVFFAGRRFHGSLGLATVIRPFEIKDQAGVHACNIRPSGAGLARR